VRFDTLSPGRVLALLRYDHKDMAGHSRPPPISRGGSPSSPVGRRLGSHAPELSLGVAGDHAVLGGLRPIPAKCSIVRSKSRQESAPRPHPGAHAVLSIGREALEKLAPPGVRADPLPGCGSEVAVLERPKLVPVAEDPPEETASTK
jgi:hypothetical protein